MGDAKWITMNHVTIENTSQTAAKMSAPPAGIGNSGQEVLIENSQFHGAYHFIAIGASVPGPSVYYNITSDGKEAEAGPHQRRSTGGLFDTVTTGNTMSARNALNEGSGHGWQGANFVFWNVNGRLSMSAALRRHKIG